MADSRWVTPYTVLSVNNIFVSAMTAKSSQFSNYREQQAGEIRHHKVSPVFWVTVYAVLSITESVFYVKHDSQVVSVHEL